MQLENPFSKLVFLFLEFTLEKITNFNLCFQSNEGLIGFLYSDIVRLYKTLLQMFYKIENLNNEEILKIDFIDTSKIMIYDELSLGYKYKSYSESLVLESHEERTHYRNLISFLVRACREIKERFLVNCDDLKLLGLLDPDVILKIDNRFFHFSKLLQRFGFINDEATNIKIENEDPNPH